VGAFVPHHFVSLYIKILNHVPLKLNYYLLFLYGDLGNSDEFSHFVNALFEPLTDERVKWVQDRYSAICHFSSEENIESINEFFNYILDDRITVFLLLERPNRLGMKLDDRVANHLFDLKLNTGYFNPQSLFRNQDDFDTNFVKWNQKEIEDLGFKDDFRDFTDEEDSPNDVRQIRRNYKQPLGMDEILDKIAAKGIESLTSEEKKYLKNLSD
jgi:hypothetical protein